MVTGFRVVVAIAALLMILAVRAVFVGYESYTPVFFAQLYIVLFGALMMFPTFVRTNRSAAIDHVILLIVAAALGAMLFGMAAPRIGEPNYCGGRYLLSSVMRVPSVYRCTETPFAVAGWFAGWWVVIWMMDWWTARIGVDSQGVPIAAEPSPPWVAAVVVLAAGLLILAVGKLFVGSSSFKPIAVAQIYIWLVTLFLVVPTLLRAEQRPAADWYLLFVGALVGAVVFWNIAPQIGEPNYCIPLPRGLRVMRDLANEISRDVGVPVATPQLPKVFRCTNLPFAIVGGFAGWWLILWWSVRRKSG
jgi:hypothetical protein